MCTCCGTHNVNEEKKVRESDPRNHSTPVTLYPTSGSKTDVVDDYYGG